MKVMKILLGVAFALWALAMVPFCAKNTIDASCLAEAALNVLTALATLAVVSLFSFRGRRGQPGTYHFAKESGRCGLTTPTPDHPLTPAGAGLTLTRPSRGANTPGGRFCLPPSMKANP